MAEYEQWLSQAIAFHQQGNLADAKQLYLRVLDTCSDHPIANRLLGTVLAQQSDYQQSIYYLNRALEINPQDTEAHNNLGIALKDNGNIEDSIEHFTQAIQIQPNHPDAIINLGDAYCHIGDLDKAETVLQEALNVLGDNPKVFNNLGIVMQKKGLLQKSITFFYNSLCVYSQGTAYQFHHNFGALICNIKSHQKNLKLLVDMLQHLTIKTSAISNLGAALYTTRLLNAAEVCYLKALALTPDAPFVRCNLGLVYIDQGKINEGIGHIKIILDLHPNNIEAHVNYGYGLAKLGKHDKAIERFRQALVLELNNANAHFHLAYELLLTGQLQEGWTEYEWRFKAGHAQSSCLPIPQWDGSSLVGKTLLVYSEQGLGDTMQFVRYLPQLKLTAHKIILQCHADLVSLFKSIEAIDNIIIELKEQYIAHFKVDYQISLLSLPRLMGPHIHDIPNNVPYFFPPQSSIRQWQKRMNNTTKLKVGIAWAGKASHQDDQFRSMSLQQFIPLADVGNIEFYCLQKGPAATQIKDHCDNINLIDLTSEFKNFSDMATVITQLDVVITVDTSVAHVAGGIGKPVFLLLNYFPDWRWLLNREDSPWYPTVKLFRQTTLGDWVPVIQAVKSELKLLARAKMNKKTPLFA